MLEAASPLGAAPVHHERRRPETTALYRVVQQHAETFMAQAHEAGGLPEFIAEEFDAYLRCGILAHGFLRLRCEGCGHGKLVAFSCKRRGICPSCGARRMAQTAALLVDGVIPHVPVRQWVLSLPIPLRVLLAAQPALATPVLHVVQRSIERLLLKQAGLKAKQAQGGAVTLIQRFGSAANLNIHLHCLVLDGVFRHNEGVRFVEAPPLDEAAIRQVLDAIVRRLMRLLVRRGALVQEDGATYLAGPAEHGDDEAGPAQAMRQLQAAACTYRIAFGPRAGRKLLTLRGAEPADEHGGSRAMCAEANGFNLHAGVRCAAHERDKLERLVRYVARPALANERIEYDEGAGRVTIGLKTPWRDGTTHLAMTPLEFMQRLAALVPRPRLHLIRFHGVLAPNAKLRPLVVPMGPPAPRKAVETEDDPFGEGPAPPRRNYIPWAKLLARVLVPT